jgi:8-oxo-dGTP pyrophosphatase MutT (NUDIX family)
VVVAREGTDGIEVAVLRRTASNRFAPGFVVFPGGAVDGGDERLAARWFGDESEAARACAVRELGEETGLALTQSGLRPVDPGDDPVEAVSASPPPAAALAEIARWIAPEFLAVRFDAVFFAVPADAALPLRPDGTEEDRAWWARPTDVLAEGKLYETLMWPTYRTLEALARCRSVGDVLALSVPQEAPPRGGRGRSPEWGRAEHAADRPPGDPP